MFLFRKTDSCERGVERLSERLRAACFSACSVMSRLVVALSNRPNKLNPVGKHFLGRSIFQVMFAKGKKNNNQIISKFFSICLVSKNYFNVLKVYFF